MKSVVEDKKTRNEHCADHDGRTGEVLDHVDLWNSVGPGLTELYLELIGNLVSSKRPTAYLLPRLSDSPGFYRIRT